MSESLYFRPTWDHGFKKIFCTPGNEKLALQLLNAVIDDKKIVQVEPQNPHHQINAETFSIFDFYCKCDDGTWIIVEMQNAGGRTLFMNRALAYSAMAILDQAKPKWKYDFKKVYFVGILNYVHFQDRTQAFTKVMLQTLDDHLVTNNNYLQIFIELPKLASVIDSSIDEKEIFLCALRDIGTDKDKSEQYKRDDLDLLFKAARFNTLSEDEKLKFENDMTTEEDYREYWEDRLAYAQEEAIRQGLAKGMEQGLAKGMEEGIAKGMEEGIVKGVEEGKKEGIKEGKIEGKIEGAQSECRRIAKAMKENGLSEKQISQCTGLCLEEIRTL